MTSRDVGSVRVNFAEPLKTLYLRSWAERTVLTFSLLCTMGWKQGEIKYSAVVNRPNRDRIYIRHVIEYGQFASVHSWDSTWDSTWESAWDSTWLCFLIAVTFLPSYFPLFVVALQPKFTRATRNTSLRSVRLSVFVYWMCSGKCVLEIFTLKVCSSEPVYLC